MNPSQAIRAAGFTALLSISGEQLQYGQTQLTGLVNRHVAKLRDGLAARDGQLDFDIMGMTEIEVLMSAMPSAPAAGQNFVDELGFRHRIRYVTHSDISWVCYCTPVKTA